MLVAARKVLTLETDFAVGASPYAEHECIGGLVTFPGVLPPGGATIACSTVVVGLQDPGGSIGGEGIWVHVFDLAPTASVVQDGARLDLAPPDFAKRVMVLLRFRSWRAGGTHLSSEAYETGMGVGVARGQDLHVALQTAYPFSPSNGTGHLRMVLTHG